MEERRGKETHIYQPFVKLIKGAERAGRALIGQLKEKYERSKFKVRPKMEKMMKGRQVKIMEEELF